MTKEAMIKRKEKHIRLLRNIIKEQRKVLKQIEYKLDHGLKTKDTYEKERMFREIYRLI